MPEKYNRNQLKQMDKADLIDLIEALFARKLKHSKTRCNNKAPAQNTSKTSWPKQAKTAVSLPQVIGIKNGEPGVYEQRRGESQVDKRAIPVIRFL